MTATAAGLTGLASVRLPCRILATGAALPERVVSNREVGARCGVDETWIERRTGIRSRRWASPTEASSDLGTRAARAALEESGVAPSEVDLVICATCSPDHLFPSTAALVGHAVGARGAGALDVQAGCAGFVYALVVAAQSVATGIARRALVVGADVMSRLVDPTDRAVAPLFGDGAGAAVIAPSDGRAGIESAFLGADGSGANLLRLPAGGSRKPSTAETLERGEHVVHMTGQALFRRAVRATVTASRTVLDRAGVSLADVDVVVPHQSSRRLLEATRRELGLPPEKLVTNVENLGNTSCASVALALHEALDDGRARAGGRALLLGYGAGLSWGACLLRL